MLSCKNLTVRAGGAGDTILSDASVSFKPFAMNAVIGPSGCGKTTLLKAMLKIIPSEGDSFFCGEKINRSEDIIGKVGYAPQFTCAHPKLSVREAIEGALRISVADRSGMDDRVNRILEIIGLDAHADKHIESLSGGQLRRIGLGIELANNPPAMFCDEVTSGLDPLSENAILDLLKGLCEREQKTFICIIHNLAKLDYFDTVSVIFEGEVVFQGNPQELNAHFEIDSPLKLYDALNAKGLDYWRAKKPASEDYSTAVSEPVKALARPSGISQLLTLLSRRLKLFMRDASYMILTMAITFGFPLVVVIFALDGLPQIQGLELDRSLGLVEEFQSNLNFRLSAAHTSTLVTGLILFQVVLLTLMGSNTGAREIAGERNLYEKERLLGLRPWAYAFSKILFVSAIALFQGVWMCAFVKYICEFPGSFLVQAAVMGAACISMTIVCLAFSAIFASPDKANIVAIYLVGFQLPLSGIVLALPESLKWICRPVINSYWGWAGYMGSMKDTRLYDSFILSAQSPEQIPSPTLCIIVLTLQALVAFAFIMRGCIQKKWI